MQCSFHSQHKLSVWIPVALMEALKLFYRFHYQMNSLHWDSNRLLNYATSSSKSSPTPVHVRNSIQIDKTVIENAKQLASLHHEQKLRNRKLKTIERIQCLSAFCCWKLQSETCFIDCWFFAMSRRKTCKARLNHPDFCCVIWASQIRDFNYLSFSSI